MAWVSVSEGMEGGGTEFPLLPAPVFRDLETDQRTEAATEEERFWCRFLECVDGRVVTGEDGMGVTFRAVEGNAVFWANFRADGSGDGYAETWHAGLPVRKGVKVGLNIWTSGRI